MKLLFTLFGLITLFQSFGCPSCNIHNYLYSSINSSSQIYVGEILSADTSNNAYVIIKSFLKNDSLKGLKIGDSIQEYVYNAHKKVGKCFIFSNPIGFGVNFPLLEEYFEEEIKLLIKNSHPENTKEAIVQLNGISNISNKRAWMYFEKNNHDSLSNEIINNLLDILDSCKLNPEYNFYDHRIKNSIIILIKLNNNIESRLISIINEINYSEFKTYTWNDYPYNQQGGLGSFFRYLLEESSNKKAFQKSIISNLETKILEDSNTGIQFFSYGLSFVDKYDWKKEFKTISEQNKIALSKGIFLAATWYRTWYREEKVSELKKQLLLFDNTNLEFIEARLSFK